MGKPNRKICAQESCNLYTLTASHRFCYRHNAYSRKNVTIQCDIEDCPTLRSFSGRFCTKHAKRKQRHGAYDVVKVKKGKVKKIPTWTAFNEEDWAKVAECAAASKQTISEWIRTVVIEELKTWD